MATQIYGDASGASSHGQNTKIHYYDKAGVDAANAVAVYTQFADRRSMPLKCGKTYKVSKWLHIADRATNSADFAKLGYLTARDVLDVSEGLTNDAALPEGAGDQNHQSIQKVTIETNFSRYGEMIPYSDEVDMFSEDIVQVRYREELGLLANQRSEDLVQLDMLGTSNVMYSGTATAVDEIGTDANAAGTTDDLARVSYDLIRRGVRRLVRNRAVRNTEIVTGSTKIGTELVNKAFYAIIGPEVKYDLESAIRGTVADNGTTQYVYVPAYKYADASKLAEGEVGKMNDVRFIESESAMVYRGAGDLVPGSYLGNLSHSKIPVGRASTLGTLTGGTSYQDDEDRFDAFPILFPTKGSFATVGLKGNNKIKFNAKAPSDVSIVNPYGTKGFFSYNLWYAGIILREERLLKIVVAASE